MEQSDSNSAPEHPQNAEDTSMGTLITNVFASPREAFETIAGTEVKHLRWVIPFLASLLLMFGSIYLLTSNPTFSRQVQDARVAGIQQRVDQGELTQAQADQFGDQMSQGSTMFQIIGAIVGSIFTLLYFVVGALFLWLAGKFVLKADAPYPKYLELYGLSSWVGIFGAIVTIVMMIGMDTMYASASGALAVLADFDPMNKTHILLKSLDLFAAWQAVIVGMGLSAVAKKENGIGIGVAVVLWIIWIGARAGLGLGAM